MRFVVDDDGKWEYCGELWNVDNERRSRSTFKQWIDHKRGLHIVISVGNWLNVFLMNSSKRICLFFSRRQSQTRSSRLCLCCIFFLALFLVTILVLFIPLLFPINDTKLPNTTVEVELLWTTGFPKLLTETAFRLVDCNSDGVLDVIFGYGTGVDTLADNRLLCDLYFNGIYPCNGGVKVRIIWNMVDRKNKVVFP